MKCLGNLNALVIKNKNIYVLGLLRYLRYYLWWSFLLFAQLYALIEFRRKELSRGLFWSKLLFGYSMFLLVYEHVIPFVYRYFVVQQRNYKFLYFYSIFQIISSILFASGVWVVIRILIKQVQLQKEFDDVVTVFH